MAYEPTIESLRQHQVPEWYHDAKLGIFIHWGLYSVPGWAPLSGDITKIIAEHGWAAMFSRNPYAEWYLNSLKFENSATRKYHESTWGVDFTYDQFAPLFNQAVTAWDPQDWASLFQQVGARYVVLTTKHHDGFTLWPTAHPCPRKPDYYATRDLVGELTDAVRGRGLRMGLYYSGGLDWSFNETRIEDVNDTHSTIVQEPEFVAYANAHWRELIDRYQPALLWNDIGYPTAANLPELFAYYYNRVPEGIINDRFAQVTTREAATGDDMLASPQGRHYDIITPEYTSFPDIQTQKWETCRGIGHSFGYNRNEGDEQLISVEALIHLFVDIVSKNGNLLLNIGPMADGTIPANQRQRLEGLGAWLQINGEAMFGSRPWVQAEGRTAQGISVRYTQQGRALYATLLGSPTERQIRLEGLAADANATVQLLGRGGVLAWQQENADMVITLPENLPDSPAHCFKITPLPTVAR
ncbi:MAG: alpha-L-fucosidase [Chloroflexi bacterium]|jgi:alpha-L-fucosidase|nr:alpha-L-fucosidase [Chloroflexota bacterium]